MICIFLRIIYIILNFLIFRYSLIRLIIYNIEVKFKKMVSYTV